MTVEVTERELTAAPADLIALVDMYRSWGWGIAFDDVGVDPRSIALIPFLRPDVIKLDMMFIHEPITRTGLASSMPCWPRPSVLVR